MSAFDVSVIVPYVNGHTDLRDCLTALRQQENARVEMMVVSRKGPAEDGKVREQFPDAVVIPVAGDISIPEMRAMAIGKASAPAVAVIEDHVIVPRDWAWRLIAALDEGHDVVGGAIENAATERYVDWAAFLCEYSGSLPPLPSGPSEGVPGNNVIYRKSVLDRYKAVLAEHKWEDRLHGAMRADGVELIMRPDIVVGHKMHYTVGLYTSQRFLYSRSYAGARVRGAPLGKRLAMGAAAFALPPLMFYRTMRRIVAKRVHLGHLVKSVPLLCLFVLSWGAGEVVGYWFGPGRSMSLVR